MGMLPELAPWPRLSSNSYLTLEPGALTKQSISGYPSPVEDQAITPKTIQETGSTTPIDPLMLDWFPCSELSSQDSQHKIVLTSECMSFELRWGHFITKQSLTYILITLILMGSSQLSFAATFFGFLGALVLPMGLVLLPMAGTTLISHFDLKQQKFWQVKKWSSAETEAPTFEGTWPEIAGLQVLVKEGQGRKSSTFPCYELNLVMNSGHRWNVISHGDKRLMEAQSRTLAQFLSVPIWARFDSDWKMS